MGSARLAGPRRCTSFKAEYVSLAQAEDAAEDQMDAGFVRPGCHLTPYLCEECGRWHLANRQIVFPRE